MTYACGATYNGIIIPATTSDVATNESMALAYSGSLSVRAFEVRRHRRVATPSIMAPYRTGTLRILDYVLRLLVLRDILRVLWSKCCFSHFRHLSFANPWAEIRLNYKRISNTDHSSHSPLGIAVVRFRYNTISYYCLVTSPVNRPCTHWTLPSEVCPCESRQTPKTIRTGRIWEFYRAVWYILFYIGLLYREVLPNKRSAFFSILSSEYWTQIQ